MPRPRPKKRLAAAALALATILGAGATGTWWLRAPSVQPETPALEARAPPEVPVPKPAARSLADLPRHARELRSAAVRTAFFSDLIHDSARAHGVDAGLFHALVIQESKGDPFAISKAGAAGLAQFMTPTAREKGLAVGEDHKGIGVDDRRRPEKAIPAAAAYLAKQTRRFDDATLGLAAYNAGAARVERAIRKAGSRAWSRVRAHLPPETRVYVQRVHDIRAALLLLRPFVPTPPTLYTRAIRDLAPFQDHRNASLLDVANAHALDLRHASLINPHAVYADRRFTNMKFRVPRPEHRAELDAFLRAADDAGLPPAPRFEHPPRTQTTPQKPGKR